MLFTRFWEKRGRGVILVESPKKIGPNSLARHYCFRLLCLLVVHNIFLCGWSDMCTVAITKTMRLFQVVHCQGCRKNEKMMCSNIMHSIHRLQQPKSFEFKSGWVLIGCFASTLISRWRISIAQLSTQRLASWLFMISDNGASLTAESEWSRK